MLFLIKIFYKQDKETYLEVSLNPSPDFTRNTSQGDPEPQTHITTNSKRSRANGGLTIFYPHKLFKKLPDLYNKPLLYVLISYRITSQI